MNDMHSFLKAKTNAINELHEMKKRAAENGDYTEQKSSTKPLNNDKTSLKNFNSYLSNVDLVIIGLLLILSKDCHDTWLFWALLYILM